MIPNFVDVVNVAKPICCHIGSGILYLHVLLKKLSHYYLQ